MKVKLYPCFDKWLKYDNIYVISDPHFGDLDLYKVRFPTTFQEGTEYMHESLVKQLDEMQIKKINSKAGKNSLLICLGDVGNIKCVKKLKARYKILIMGNHDKGASNYKRQVFFNDNFNEPRFYGQLGSRHISSNSYKELEDLGCTNIKKGQTLIEEDNHLFDEVYEGPLMISSKIILSHEPVSFPYAINIHGHDHSKSEGHDDELHINVCAEHVDYTPISLSEVVKSGKLNKAVDIHRQTIDKAIKRKVKRLQN